MNDELEEQLAEDMRNNPAQYFWEGLLDDIAGWIGLCSCSERCWMGWVMKGFDTGSLSQHAMNDCMVGTSRPMQSPDCVVLSHDSYTHLHAHETGA